MILETTGAPLLVKKYGGKGKTGRQQQGIGFELTGDEQIDAILEDINRSAGTGTFNEGQLNKAISHYEDLKGRLEKGDISQGDFSRITSAFMPDMWKFGHEMAGRGSAGANATAGARSKLDKFNKEYQVYSAGQELLGRDLTPQEIAEFMPKFSDLDTGRAYIAEIAKEEAKSPAALRRKSGQFSGQVGDVFKSLLGRDASANELEHYGSLLATGEISPYEIESLVKRGTEFQGKEDKAFRGGLKDELLGYNREAADDAREDIISRLKRSGVSASEDAVAAALAESEEDLSGEMNRYLSSISSAQYGGNKEAAMGDYRDVLDQFLAGQDYSKRRSDSMLDYYTGRSDSISDYNRQMQDYMNFLNSQPKKKGSNPLTAALMGAGSLAPLGWGGAAAGAGAGLFASFLD